jgi:hypothetical protein
MNDSINNSSFKGGGFYEINQDLHPKIITKEHEKDPKSREVDLRTKKESFASSSSRLVADKQIDILIVNNSKQSTRNLHEGVVRNNYLNSGSEEVNPVS